MNNTAPKSAPTAFTLTELLVVISLIVLLLAIAVPAFSSMLYNNDRSLAENQFKIAMATARDQAIRSEGGDTAAVFMYQPGGKLRIVTCVSVATLDDEPNLGPISIPNLPTRITGPRKREIFVPVSIVNPIDLPRGWAIRAYVPPQEVDTGRWYGSNVDGDNAGPLEARYPLRDGCWVFPETGFYVGTVPPNISSAGRTNNCRTSFMVRFEAGTGALVNNKPEEALVIDLAPIADRTGLDDSLQLQQSADLTATVRRLLDTHSIPSERSARDTYLNELRNVIGDRSSDTILVRPVSQLAILDERKMVQQFGQGAGQLNRVTNSLYGDPAATTTVPTTPRIDTSLFGGATPVEVNSWVSQWIVGSYQSRDGAVGEARIFNIDKVSGLAREVTQ